MIKNQFSKIKYSQIVLLLTVSLFLFGFSHNVAAATYYWVGGTTDSDTSNLDNWNTSAGVCADSGNLVVPGAADTVIFTGDCLNDATIDSDLSVAKYDMSDDYTGTTTLDASTLSIATELAVDGGALSVLNGGVVTAPPGTGGIIIGKTATGNGTIIVDGVGSNITQTISGTTRIRIGNTTGAVGNLIIRNGATVSTGNIYAAYSSGATANITVDGVGTVWNSDIAEGVGFIGRAGEATLTVSDGAVINSNAGPWQVGGNAGGSGDVTVTGVGSQINFTNSGSNLRVGYSGTGVLTLQDGAELTSAQVTVADQVGSVGTLNIGSGYTTDSIITTLGMSTGSGTASVPPFAPTSVVASATTTSMAWDWEDVTGATGYKVYGTDDTLLATISSATSDWLQEGLTPNTGYSILVRGTNSYGEGGASSSVTKETLASPSKKSGHRRRITTEAPDLGESVENTTIILETQGALVTHEVRLNVLMNQLKTLLTQYLEILKNQAEDLLR